MDVKLSIFPPKTKKFFLWLSKQDFIRKFYLAGGTACALYFAHRRSQDLDFFSMENFQTARLLKELRRYGKWKEFKRDWGTLVGALDGIKLSFFTVPEKIIKPFYSYVNIKIADPVDLGLMKIMTIADRGTKRDFIDLYILCHKVMPLNDFLNLLAKKYKKGEYNMYHILRSLIYFSDAEKDHLPKMLIEIQWEEVKKFFQNEVKILTKKLIGLR